MSNLWTAMNLNDTRNNRMAFESPNLGDLSTMPWSSSNPGLMQFTGTLPESQSPSVLHAKRKPAFTDDPPVVPSKKMLTEDSMAAHLSNLHISGGSSSGGSLTHPRESMDNYTVNMSQWDLERKLRTAQKITVCNEILELDKKRDTILPEILLNRIAKPCSALMLWQPPPSLSNLIDIHGQGPSTDKREDPVKNDSATAAAQSDENTEQMET